MHIIGVFTDPYINNCYVMARRIRTGRGRRRAPIRRRRSVKRFGRGRRVRKRVQRPTRSIQRSPTISDTQFVKLKYTDSINTFLGANTTTISYATYDVNNLVNLFNANQPVGTNAGSNTVAGLLEWSGLYRYFRVYAVKVSTDFMNNNTAPCYVGHYFPTGTQTTPISSNPVVWSTWFALQENQFVQMKAMTSSGGNRQMVTVNSYMNLGRLWGDPSQYKSDDNFFGGTPTGIAGGIYTGGTVPINLMCLNVFGISYDPGVNLLTVLKKTRITYYVKFYGRKPQVS